MNLKVLVGLIVGLVLAWLAVRGVDLSGVWEEISALPAWVWLSVAALFLLQQLLRAWRQQLLLQPVAPETTLRTNLSVLCISFFCINTFPMRLGELVRPYLFMERERISIGAGFGVVALERLLDLASAIAVLFAVLLILDLPDSVVVVAGQEVDLFEIGRRMAMVGLFPLFFLLLAMAAAPSKVIALVRWCAELAGRLLPFGPVRRLSGMMERFSESFLDGVGTLREPSRLASVLALTAITWGSSGFIYVILAHGFGLEGIGWGAGMGVLVITMLGTALPAPPGFAGVYEFSVVTALALFGVGHELAEVALAFALVVHWWTWLVQSSTALFFFVVDGVSLKQTIDYTRRSTTA